MRDSFLKTLSLAQDSEVLMRVDFNIPIINGKIGDDTRIRAALPSIKLLLSKGAKLVLMSHLGRPNPKQREAKFSLNVVASRLAELLGKPVGFATEAVGEKVDSQRLSLKAGEVLLLENVRFYEQEMTNDQEFSKRLVGRATTFINDAFGSSHRVHASTVGVASLIERRGAGLLVERELEYLVNELTTPARPFLVILGGAKVSDKINVIKSLLERADRILIGGAMAYTFLKAQGFSTGDSLVEDDKLELALELLDLAKQKVVEFYLPVDTRITQEFSERATTKLTDPYSEGGEIPQGWEGIDIGDRSIELFKNQMAQAKTIFWNGPMGVFEIEPFSQGTYEIAKTIAEVDAMTIIGGGDSVAALKKFGFEDQVSFVSTGGGASLELLEGKLLPGIAVLSN